jgi:hypothetical protein
VLDLFPELSFGDNVRPSQVTSALRERLVQQQIRRRNSCLVSIICAALLFNVGLGAVARNSPGALAWPSFFALEATALTGIIFGTWMWYSRRIRFLREAPVTPAAIMESDTTSLWGVEIPWMRSSPRSIAEAVEEDQEGDSQSSLHIVKVRLRFRPGTTKEQLNWDDLGDEVPHCEVIKRLGGGGWGTFASGLKVGSLVSLLYSPQNPRHCRIIQRFHSTQSQIE